MGLAPRDFDHRVPGVVKWQRQRGRRELRAWAARWVCAFALGATAAPFGILASLVAWPEASLRVPEVVDVARLLALSGVGALVVAGVAFVLTDTGD